MIIATALADTAQTAAAAPQQPSVFATIVPFALMFAVFYFLLIRPQQKKMKEQQEMVNSLQKGDEVVTASGIIGKITGLTEKVATVEIDNNVRIKMLRAQISQVLKGDQKIV